LPINDKQEFYKRLIFSSVTENQNEMGEEGETDEEDISMTEEAEEIAERIRSRAGTGT